MVWVTGAKGILGTEICKTLNREDIDYVATGSEVDITDIDEVNLFAHNRGRRISWIVNCAAYTAVDKAENEAALCEKINFKGAENVAKIAKGLGCPLIHFSTDYVFDGTGSVTYREDDPAQPVSVYGKTKLQGERAVAAFNERFYIVRTSWLYGRGGKNFVNTMLCFMNELDSFTVVNDQIGSPTNAADLSFAALQFIKKADHCEAGIYNYSNEGVCTWFEFANEIYRLGRLNGLIKKECFICPCTTVECPTKAPRPAFSVLDKTKIKKTLQIDIPDWKTSLRKYLEND
ncbi:NAD(P)-dependent oxidoreductase [Spirochaetia bacterium]|nr:NAD(P)-dependent oxidoreductase [Spirochaetia bacterium]